MFLRWAWGSSGSAKMLEAILFLRAGGFSSSVPKEMLDPPPGGRSTLKEGAHLVQSGQDTWHEQLTKKCSQPAACQAGAITLCGHYNEGYGYAGSFNIPIERARYPWPPAEEEVANIVGEIKKGHLQYVINHMYGCCSGRIRHQLNTRFHSEGPPTIFPLIDCVLSNLIIHVNSTMLIA